MFEKDKLTGSAAGGTIPFHLNLRGPKIHDHNVKLFDNRMSEWDLSGKLHNTTSNRKQRNKGCHQML